MIHALSLAAAAASVTMAVADLKVPFESMPPIVRCVVESLRVDGLPIVQHGWCIWDGRQKMWVPLSSDLARTRVFGIRPIEE